jgi:polyisoprenoid-binding protein YceI
MKSNRTFAVVTLVAAAASGLLTPWPADAKVARSGEPAVSFSATGPAGMKIVGTTSELSVADDGSNLSVVVPLSNLKTGISLRDQHMREKYLQVAKFPNAELSVARGSIKFPVSASEASADAQGTMKIHGVSKPVTFHYSAKKDGAKLSVSGSVRVNVKDFGIDIPSYLGVTVNPDIGIAVKFDATDG